MLLILHPDDFDGNLAGKREIIRQVDLTHSPASKQLPEIVRTNAVSFE